MPNSRFVCLTGSRQRKLNKNETRAVFHHRASGSPKSVSQVMKSQLKSVRRGSKTAAASQPKTAQSRGLVRPASALPLIALFPEGDGERSGGVSSELVDLSQAEYAVLKRAGAASSGILMFMANAALEKASGSTSTSIQSAIQVLVDLAIRKVHDCPIDEQIVIWRPLSETLPGSSAREHACNIARLQSEVAARHLQFTDILSGKAAQRSDQRTAA